MGKKQSAVQSKKQSVFESLEGAIKRNADSFSIVIILLSILTGFFVFQFGISAAADDASYIIRGLDFIKKGTWPGEQGPLYSIILGFILAVAGIHIPLLKVFTLATMVGFVFLFWRFYIQRVSPLVVLSTLLITLLSPTIMSYASINYAEMTFLFLSILVIIQFFKFFDQLENKDFDVKEDAKQLIVLSALVLALYLTRTVGLAIAGPIALFLLIHKKFKAAGAFILALAGMAVLLTVIKYLFWDIQPFTNNQASVFWAKDAYDASKGNETWMGFVTRFHENSKQYLSNHFWRMMGLKAFGSQSKSALGYAALYALSLGMLIYIFKKNKYLAFAGMYGLGLCGITFVLLHVFWNQDRLLIPFFPFIVLFLLGSILHLIKEKAPGLKPYWYILLLVLPLFSFNAYTKQVNIKNLQEGLLGNKFYSYTPEWRNYLQAFEYIGEKEPRTTFAACRKPDLGRIYSGGRMFYHISSSAEAKDVDALLLKMKTQRVNMFVLDNCIGTFSIIYKAVEEKYPGTFISVKQFGDDGRSTYLCRIKYPASIK